MSEIATAIIAGQHDDELTAIRQALAIRHDIVKTVKQAEIKNSVKAGDIVQIPLDSPLRPKKLHGVNLKVEKVNRTTISVAPVDVSGELGKWRYGFKVPAEHLAVVNSG